MIPESKVNHSPESFTTRYLQNLAGIFKDTNERLHKVEELDAATTKLAEITDLFGKGIWYPEDYSRGLKKFGQEQRFKHLVDKQMTFFGRAPSKCFERLPGNFLGKQVCGFQLKPDKTVAEGINAITEEFSLLDCGTATQVAFYSALQSHLGTEKMEALFIPQVIQNEGEMRPGDLCHFSNIANQALDGQLIGYVRKHPVGYLREHNVLCLRVDKENSYLGFGLNSDGVSREEIEKLLWNGFNAAPLEEGYISPEIWEELFSKYLCRDREKSKALVQSLSERSR